MSRRPPVGEPAAASARLCSLLLVSAALALAAAGTLEGEMQSENDPLQVGDAVPDFTLPDLDGGEHTLSQRRGEGPVVLVFFRGAW